MEMGLVKTDEMGAYQLDKRVKVGLLEMFIGSGRLFVPRMAVYASASTGFLLSFVLLLTPLLNLPGLVLLGAHVMITLVLWAETLRILRLQPS